MKNSNEYEPLMNKCNKTVKIKLISSKTATKSNQKHLLSLILGSTILISITLIRLFSPSSSSESFNFPKRHERNPSYLVSGKNGAVASEELRCSQIGIDVLKDNGTATDAAIATALCIGVVNSFSSGIGGGGFMLIKPPKSCNHSNCKTISIDFRETITRSHYYHSKFKQNPKLSQIGGLSIGIPGEISGFYKAFELFGGGVNWERLFKPSIELSKQFKIGKSLNSKLLKDDHSNWIKRKPEWSKVFFPNGTKGPNVGDLIKRPGYSNTLEILSREGPNAFYNGSIITPSLINTINKAGGKVALQDFQNYQVIVQPALTTTYKLNQKNRTVYTTAGSSSGSILIYLLNILETYNLSDGTRTELNEHIFIEALKHSFARRTELGDPSFLNQTELSKIQTFLDKSTSDQVIPKINQNQTFDYNYYKPNYDLKEDHGTTHISVIDQFGSSVALTSTINLEFGSQIMDSKTGIILNDENDDFSISGHSNHFDLFASPSNFPQDHKRPLSSICPIIIDDTTGENVWAVIGASGGSRIPSAIVSTLLKLDWGYDLSHAIEDPRIHHQLLPNKARVETSYRPEWIDSLKAKGHEIEMVDVYTGLATVQGVMRRSDGVLFASSDSRKNGVPAAY
ncbi:hypothetical protein CROQUDRAFT_134178 [Cronartium quercuum f. sp. fusiforme G11]|uniref:Glutathione hydrolase n=1 Tax=Cronartium quercuum f. sp. fusiforme G11 TaxID=708437 RepID=A0A9P6NFS2_9BASI|nr:hypothetical protein CROQUDRAFT_134178 [Cronartium quercuum f. sp. fusiforme G11]